MYNKDKDVSKQEMQMEELYSDWYDQNRWRLEQEFLDSRPEDWCCEEEGMELLESYAFQEYCEDKFNDDINNGVI